MAMKFEVRRCCPVCGSNVQRYGSVWECVGPCNIVWKRISLGVVVDDDYEFLPDDVSLMYEADF